MSLSPGLGKPPPRVCRCIGAVHLRNGRMAAFDCENFIAALLCPTGGSILLQTWRDKEETGAACLPVIVGPAPVPLAEWQLPLTSYTRAHSWSSPWVPWPCSIQRGRGRSCQISHLSLHPKGCSPPAAGPQGPSLHTPANQLHLWEELASGGCRILFLTSTISCTFEVLCKC